jgi:hypothetical protein
MFRAGIALCLAAAMAAGPASAAPGDVHWDSRAWELNASGLPAYALKDRPEWADRQVTVESKIVWVVTVLPSEVGTWDDRLLQGTRQAEETLHAFAEYLVRARASADPIDYRNRLLSSLRYRLKTGLDREGFVKVETMERPRAVWMRFGYPADKLEQALGFDLPGVIPLDPPRADVAKAEPPPQQTVWDYAWETAWLSGVAIVTVTAVLFAQAATKNK